MESSGRPKSRRVIAHHRGEVRGDDWEVHSAYGQSYPRLIATLEDVRRSGEQFTVEVLKINAGFLQQTRIVCSEGGAR